MQTTLRIDDRLYREAKAEAAREGVTLTRFLEEALRMRLEQGAPLSGEPHHFRVYGDGPPESCSWKEIKEAANDEQESGDLAKLGVQGSAR